MSKSSRPAQVRLLIQGMLFAGLVVPSALAQGGIVDNLKPAVTPAPVTGPRASKISFPVHRAPMSSHAIDHYQLLWGVDSLDVKVVESGQMVRFSYYVRDATKSAQLNDKKANPYLIDEQARVRLEIPTMEKVGQLRQSSTPEAGKSYWMVFSNKGGVVKPGDRVSVVIGKFRADGLYVR